MTIYPERVLQQRLATSMGLDKYAAIMNSIHSTDLSKDERFQKAFVGFYMVRRNKEWLKTYFDYFEKVKDIDVSFYDVLTYLYEQTGQVEASFSSKLIASINPDMPIWDQFVIKTSVLNFQSRTIHNGWKRQYLFIKKSVLGIQTISNLKTLTNAYKPLIVFCLTISG